MKTAVIAVFCILGSNCLAADPDVAALIEVYVRDVLINHGYQTGEDDAKPSDKLAGLLESAKRAKVLNRRELKALESIGSDLQIDADSQAWKFKNDVERERKIQELQIRLKLVPDGVQAQWKRPQISILFRPQDLSDGRLLLLGGRAGADPEFEQRVSDSLIHAYVTTYAPKEERIRIALHNMPAKAAADFELKRNRTFLIFVQGTEQYESVSGIRTVPSCWYVEQSFVDQLITKYAPKPLAAPATQPKQIDRSWTSIDGKFKIEAAVVSVSEDAVTLRKEDGKEITVPLNKLSRKDSEFARAFKAAQGPLVDPFAK